MRIGKINYENEQFQKKKKNYENENIRAVRRVKSCYVWNLYVVNSYYFRKEIIPSCICWLTSSHVQFPETPNGPILSQKPIGLKIWLAVDNPQSITVRFPIKQYTYPFRFIEFICTTICCQNFLSYDYTKSRPVV